MATGGSRRPAGRFSSVGLCDFYRCRSSNSGYDRKRSWRSSRTSCPSRCSTGSTRSPNFSRTLPATPPTVVPPSNLNHAYEPTSSSRIRGGAIMYRNHRPRLRGPRTFGRSGTSVTRPPPSSSHSTSRRGVTSRRFTPARGSPVRCRRSLTGHDLPCQPVGPRAAAARPAARTRPGRREGRGGSCPRRRA